ncbi:hypothetical protein [Latilactobacillus fuchuensis]|uniref:spr1630 family ClpXP-sensitive toxin n=1 Tax=Latilactobacillus fuchuensis TaxID=164393 RepID=UPI0020C7B128|nr:hypothetical protein [Latilactobacillus fuchuensis]MCP8856783.1 hypothetical protein [Latilactobacillus fuchuensis]
MDNLELTEAVYKVIVDGTLKGYLQYLEERKQKKATMAVSGAYAWTKGNHVDDQVAKMGHDLDFTIEKAGYTWEYLQFYLDKADEKFMIIVKNAKRVQQSLIKQQKQDNEHNYLYELAGCNVGLLRHRQVNSTRQPEQIQLELSDPNEVQAILSDTRLEANQKFSRFYIVTYEIDEQSKMISTIQLTMLNRETMTLELIEDLTRFIQQSDYQPTVEDVAPIMDESEMNRSVFSGDSNAFGYSIPVEKKATKEQ